MGKTRISWTDTTWNPIRGCSRVSEGCRHCYAEQQAARIVRMSRAPGRRGTSPYDGLVKPHSDGYAHARWTGKVAFDALKLADPLSWRKPRRAFVNSMSDLFHESLTNEQIAAVFGVMAACPHITFQTLTKRSRRMREWFAWAKEFAIDQREIAAAPNTARTMLNAAAELLGIHNVTLNTAWRRLTDDAWPLPNVHLGVSTENQDAFDERWPDLLRCPAAVWWFSAEPLVSAIDMTYMLADIACKPGVLWLIAGCESGSGARPCDDAWLRAVRDQCATAQVPFFLKQAVACCVGLSPMPGHVHFGAGSNRKAGGIIELPYLDGVQHADFPAVAS